MSADKHRIDDLLVLRALAALLAYPTRELVAALPEIGDVLARSRVLSEADRERLAALLADLRSADALALEERYVDLFDRGRATSLHLFEHVHGESRDRGSAMVDLMQLYDSAGLHFTAHELPDYLPAVLEYLSCRTLAEARAMLGDCAHILRKIGETLAHRGSPYAAVLAAILTMAQVPGLDWRKTTAPSPEPPIDDEWAETPAFAAPGAAAAQAAVIQFMPRKPA